MNSSFDRSSRPAATLPVFDLNELLLDHPAASYVFNCDGDVLIVDRAVQPHSGSTVIVEAKRGFVIESYHGQSTWGVVTYLLHKTD